MKAILLAGGQGRRLRSITGKLPKPMVPLVGVPVLDRLLELLRRSGLASSLARRLRPIVNGQVAKN